MATQDLTGQRFGTLVVTGKAPYKKGHHNCIMWECLCDCGNTTIVRSNALRSGYTKSCGCLRKKGNPKHGMAKTRPYSIWNNMFSRCYNDNAASYANYGGRGIKICERWHDFANFWDDMKNDYRDDLTIERINNDGNYEPGNCKWATRIEQQNNTRQNVLLTYQGITKTMTQWGRDLGISRKLLEGRFYLGWTVQRMLETPVNEKCRKKREDVA